MPKLIDPMDRLRQILTLQKEQQLPEQTKQEIIDEYRAHAKAFMTQVKAWLQPFVDDGLLVVQDRSFRNNESGDGVLPTLPPYDVDGLYIETPSKRSLTLRPDARFVIGKATGRIIMWSGLRESLFLLLDGVWVWRDKQEPVDEDMFCLVISEMLS